MVLVNLGIIHRKQGNLVEADSLYRRALTINEEWLGPDNHTVASVLEELCKLRRLELREAEALEHGARAAHIRLKNLSDNMTFMSEKDAFQDAQFQIEI